MMRCNRSGSLAIVLVLLAGMALLSSGCEKPAAPPPVIQKKPARKKVAKPAASKKAPVPEQKPVFSYNPQGLVDPFKPFIRIGSGGKTVEGIPRTPLQEYDLSQLKLTAIIWMGKGKSVAMVEDSAGKGFTVKKGTFIGKRGGKVKSIELDRVIIEQPSSPYGTRSTSRDIVITMPEEGGAK